MGSPMGNLDVEANQFGGGFSSASMQGVKKSNPSIVQNKYLLKMMEAFEK